jgi:thiol:disulfide interchange protein
VKQVMGLLMLAVAAFFVGTGLDPLLRAPVDDPMRWHWYVVAGLVVLAVAWMIYVLFTRMRGGWRVVLSAVGLLFAAGNVWFAVRQNDRGPIPWVGYTPERFAQAQREAKVVVLDFTAEWCLNCKGLETSVLHTKAVAGAMTAPGVVAMRVDLTGDNPPGREKLKELRWVGIPLLAVYGPGLPEPVKYDSYTPDMVVRAIAQAGSAGAGGGSVGGGAGGN